MIGIGTQALKAFVYLRRCLETTGMEQQINSCVFGTVDQAEGQQKRSLVIT